MPIYQPRPYQADCIAALAEVRKNGIKKGLVVMASGLGKTLTAIFDLQQFLQEYPNARILCLCHQESILLQSKAKFHKFFGEEYSYGMFTGTYKTSRIVTFLFATFQTMRDHRDEFAPDTFDYVVVDEAHRVLNHQRFSFNSSAAAYALAVIAVLCVSSTTLLISKESL